MDTREYIFVPRNRFGPTSGFNSAFNVFIEVPVSGAGAIHLVEAGTSGISSSRPQQFDYGSCGFRSHCRPACILPGFRVVYHSRI